VSVNLVRALAAFQDLRIDVVTVDRGVEKIDVSAWEGATIHRLPWLGGSVLINAVGRGRRQVSAYVRALSPEVIHAHDTYGLMVKDVPIPRVFTVHGFIHGDTLVSGERFARIRSRIWKRVETGGWAAQDHIVSISPYVRERLTGVARGIVHDIDNPISEAFFHIGRKEQKGTIFSAAVISPRKNTLLLVEAMARLRDSGVDARLLLAGPVVDAGYGESVERRIRELRLADRIDLLGTVGQAAVRDELARASVFALVSLEENSPMGIEEAMAAGVPVVTSNRCGMPYIVRYGVSGYLVDPFSRDDIAKRIRMILEDDGLRGKMGEVSRAIALDRFHPAEVARRTREVYLEAAPPREEAGKG